MTKLNLEIMVMYTDKRWAVLQITALARMRIHRQRCTIDLFETFSSKDEIPSFAAACNFRQGLSYHRRKAGEFK